MSQFIDLLRSKFCFACGREGPLDIHHVRTRGAGGTDDPHNLIPFCRPCHMRWHRIGWRRFLKTYPSVKNYLTDLGWEIVGGRLKYLKDDT